MNLKNNYVGELQEFEVSTGHGAPVYRKVQAPSGVEKGKLLWIAHVKLSDGTEYTSSNAYAKYGHAKSDAAYAALSAERAVSRKNKPKAQDEFVGNDVVLRQCSGFGANVPESRTLYMSPAIQLRALMARVLALETVPATRARIVWSGVKFETMAQFATALQSLDIRYAYRSAIEYDVFDLFC